MMSYTLLHLSDTKRAWFLPKIETPSLRNFLCCMCSFLSIVLWFCFFHFFFFFSSLNRLKLCWNIGLTLWCFSVNSAVGGQSPLRLVLDPVKLVPLRSVFTRPLWGWNGLDLSSGISLIHLVPVSLWICIYAYNIYNIDKYNLSYVYLLL